MQSRRITLTSIGLAAVITTLLFGMALTGMGLRNERLLPGTKNPALEHVLVLSVSGQDEDIYNAYIDPDGGELNWIAADSVNKPPGSFTSEQVLRFNLGESPIARLRLDLGTHAETIVLHQVAIITQNGNACTWKGVEFQRLFNQAAGDIGSLTPDDGRLIVKTTGRYTSMIADPFTGEQECNRASRMTPQGGLLWLLGGLAFAVGLSLALRRMALGGAAFSDLVLVCGFLIIIALPLAAHWLNLSNTVINAENRALANAPAAPVDFERLRKFPAGWSAYFNDHFGWRNELIYWGNQIKVRLLHTTPTTGVVLGKEGWLYFSGDEAIADYQGLVKMGKADKIAIDANLQAVHSRLTEMGIDFLVIAAPDKHTIYPEYLPANIRNIGDLTRLDQFLKFNYGHANVPVLDLRPALLANKDAEPIYFRTDTHWNMLGGFHAYRKIINRLSDNFPALQPHQLSDYRLVSYPIPGMDLAKLVMMRWYFSETGVDLVPQFDLRAQRVEAGAVLASGKPTTIFEIDDPALPKAVIFHDSFARYLFPYLPEHFERSVFVWSYAIDWELIEKEQPDIVILQFVERRIMGLLPQP